MTGFVERLLPFVLGDALYMKAIHGGKAKNDRIDALKIATLLRGGMLPQAYVYPAGMRATRTGMPSSDKTRKAFSEARMPAVSASKQTMAFFA